MRKMTWSFCFLMAAGGVMAGPISPKDIAPTAKWVAHLDAQGLIASQFGQYILNELKEHEQLDAKLPAFVAIFGFDPTKDLASITIYGTEYQHSSVVVIIKGKCDKERLLTLLRTNPTYAETTYGNFTIHGWKDEPKGPHDDGVRQGAFYNDSTVVISHSEKALQSALDVLDGKVSGTADVVPTVGSGTFLLAAAKDFTMPDHADPHAQVLKRLSGGLLVAGENGDSVFANAKLTTRKPQDAQRVLQMLEGGLAFLSLAADAAQETEGQPAFWAPLLAGATATGSGDSVELKVAINTQTLIEIANAARKAEEAKKAQQAK